MNPSPQSLASWATAGSTPVSPSCTARPWPWSSGSPKTSLAPPASGQAAELQTAGPAVRRRLIVYPVGSRPSLRRLQFLKSGRPETRRYRIPAIGNAYVSAFLQHRSFAITSLYFRTLLIWGRFRGSSGGTRQRPRSRVDHLADIRSFPRSGVAGMSVLERWGGGPSGAVPRPGLARGQGGSRRERKRLFGRSGGGTP